MLFNGHKEPRHTKYASADLEIPAIVVPPAADRHTPRLQGRFDCLQPGLGTAPLLIPHGKPARPGHDHALHTTPTPGGQTVPEAATETCQGLEYMEEGCQAS